jgi:hypothetical protein
MKYADNLLCVAKMYTAKAIRVGELLTVSWDDYFISEEKAKEVADQYSGDQKKQCTCRAGCRNVTSAAVRRAAAGRRRQPARRASVHAGPP